jgi:hypothetical protein
MCEIVYLFAHFLAHWRERVCAGPSDVRDKLSHEPNNRFKTHRGG